MVVTKIKGKIVLVDSQLARVIGDNKVEVYKNENEIRNISNKRNRI